MIVFNATALADGIYQRTRDGKTIVWNQDPKPADQATWSGDRDRDGYANGFGTLTWFANSSQGAETRQTIYARYFGNMVRGRFDGPVNGHSKGVTGHAVFSDGKRVTPWAAGPVPSWKTPKLAASPEPTVRATPTIPDKYVPQFNPPPPSYGVTNGRRPIPDFDGLREQSEPVSDVPAEGPSELDRAGTPGIAKRAVSPKPKLDIDDSLLSLVGPPLPPEPGSQSAAKKGETSDATRLNERKVIQLADAEARRRGYDLNVYQRGRVQFDPVDNIWSILYNEKVEGKSPVSRKHFVVAIDERSRRTVVVSSR